MVFSSLSAEKRFRFICIQSLARKLNPRLRSIDWATSPALKTSRTFTSTPVAVGPMLKNFCDSPSSM